MLIAGAVLPYGVLQALLMLRLLPWIGQQPFTVSYWGFSFGVTALGADFLRMTERGDVGAISTLSPYIFGAVNIVITILVFCTLRLMARGQLLPVAAIQPAKAPASTP